MNEICKGSMDKHNTKGNHSTISPLEIPLQTCLLGTSEVKMTMLRDFGGNQVWMRISNDIFDSEDVLPVANEEEGEDFK